MIKQLLLFDIKETLTECNQPTEYLSFEAKIPLDLKNNSTITLDREPPLKIYSWFYRTCYVKMLSIIFKNYKSKKLIYVYKY